MTCSAYNVERVTVTYYIRVCDTALALIDLALLMSASTDRSQRFAQIDVLRMRSQQM